MPSHIFKIGQTVGFQPGRLSMPASANDYKIVKLLPAEGVDNLYRIKTESEPFERIAKERELSLRQ